MRMPRFIIVMMALVAIVLGGEYGNAAESTAHITAHSRASLITDHNTIGPDGTIKVGLRLQLQPGWHTYWVNPGDAGDAPHMSVEASGGARGESHLFQWPVPERINEGGLMAYAYTGSVLLSQTLHVVGSSGSSVTLKATADWLVCADVCVPENGEFTLTLPRSASASSEESAEASLFHAAEAALPQTSPFQTTLLPDGVLQMEGAGLSPEMVKDAWFLPLQGGMIRQTAPQKLTVTKDRVSLSLLPDASQHAPLWQVPLSGVVVLEDKAGERSAMQVFAQPVTPVASPMPPPFTAPGIAKVLLFALLGGVILNLMPCVFPVLAMKALSLARMGGAGRREQVESAAFYACGVVVSFGALGAVMIALRSVGSVAGWGFQFQSSGFVVAVCWLLFILALNLLGVFQVTTGKLAGTLDQMGRTQGRSGDVLTGFLAVLVATPCTAPFMGVAIAGALAGPVLLGMAVFLAMGLGLAAPYVLIATVPGLASRLPRPGAWMEVLKQFLAFPLLASCVWLLWVVSVQHGSSFVLVTAGGAVLLALGCWLYGLGQRRAMREGGAFETSMAYGLAVLCGILSCVGLGMALSSDQTAPSSEMARKQSGAVEPFSESRLAALRAEGTPVFVDMTASWCITCMVNERVALEAPSVRALFDQHHIVTLRGDWTNRDEAISVYLKKHGRDGVPFYLYYPPHQNGTTLPQILTPHGVIDMITHSVGHS